MKRFLKVVLNILTQKEKIKMCKLIALDFIIGVSDIVFLGSVLMVVNFYTKSNTQNNSFLQIFSNHSLLLIGLFFLLFSLKNWLGYRISSSQNFFFYRVASRLSSQNIWNYLKDDYIKFINIDSSVLIRKISQQPIEFSNYILTNIQQVISQSILICCTIIAIVFYHPALFLLLFLLLLPPVFLLGYVIKKKLKLVRAGTKITGQKTIQHLQEVLSGFIESNIYDKNGFFTNRYYGSQDQLNKNIATQQTLQGLSPRLIEVFAILGLLILITINKWFAGTPFIDLFSIGVFIAAAYKIIPGIVKILNSTGQIKTYLFVLDDLLPVEKKTIGEQVLVKNIQSLSFEQVEFQYNHHQLLNNCSFKISAGDFVGISGKSGLGKTTIVNLILGFLEQKTGTIVINHKKTSSAERQQYWNRISYVKQQPFFMNDSILKNITLTDGTHNIEALNAVLSFCGIDSMLDQYPDGINKLITENGKNISGGQRQRIMLARALYHDFDLLILDEPFSEMDEASEKMILAQLALLAKNGKMIIIITHNKASLSFCNKTIVLNEEREA